MILIIIDDKRRAQGSEHLFDLHFYASKGNIDKIGCTYIMCSIISLILKSFEQKCWEALSINKGFVRLNILCDTLDIIYLGYIKFCLIYDQ